MTRLPTRFLEWNYYPRRELVRRLLLREGGRPEEIFLQFMRHNPVLITGAILDGRVRVNGKVVGCGYVVKEELLNEVSGVFRNHIARSDEEYEGARDREARKRVYEEHARRGSHLLLKYIYLPKGEADRLIDFEVLATVELAKSVPWSTKETWRLVQLNRRASLVFFQPPVTSFEVKGEISVHIDDPYHEFVTLVHDAYHYTPKEERSDRPVYLLHVEEVYDKSATSNGFGRRIA